MGGEWERVTDRETDSPRQTDIQRRTQTDGEIEEQTDRQRQDFDFKGIQISGR